MSFKQKAIAALEAYRGKCNGTIASTVAECIGILREIPEDAPTVHTLTADELPGPLVGEGGFPCTAGAVEGGKVMDRLTGKHYRAADYYMTCSENCDNDAEMCGGCPFLEKIINRLGAYEDTGLEPEEIADVQKEIGTALALERELRDHGNMWSFDHLRELVQAEKAGRLFVLPCKVGDTVYRVVTKKKYLNNPKNAMYIKEIVIKPENFHKYIHEIGKTVFLTREEAEAALKGGANETDL